MSADELARAVRERRAELGLSIVEVGRGGGPAAPTMRNVERAVRRPREPTQRALDIALAWPQGTARAYLNGWPPPAAEPTAEPAAEPAAEAVRWYRRGADGRPTEVAATPRTDLSVVAMLARASSTEELYTLAHVVLDELARRERERGADA